jgi:hypothetical protein
VERFLDDSINLCGSDLTGIKDKYGEECNPSWQCGTEPVICPPHGEQKLICIDSNCDETRESTIYCSPGICSGCYVPKWFGYLENTKCIPYGFRFAQEDGDREKLEERTELNSNGEVEFEIKIIDDYTAYMKLTVGAIFGGEHNETVFEETIYEGSKHTIYLQDYGEENIEFKVDRIVPGKDGNNGFVYLTVIGKRDAYCDIDGEIKQQKKKDYNGKLAECQNNYECRSNVCSNGKCLEVEEVINEAGNMKSLLYRVLCRLINLFDNDDYDQCIYNYLGSMSSSGGGSGGGGSSSPQIPQ